MQDDTRRSGSKRILVTVLVVLAAGFGAMQFIPYGRSHANPASFEPAWDAPQTRELFAAACADCHSHRTVWPWYSHVAPVSWLVQRDVDLGRAAFNVSVQGRLPEDSQELGEEVTEGEMPLRIYTILHPDARLAPEERTRLAAGLLATFQHPGAQGADRHDDGEDD